MTSPDGAARAGGRREEFSRAAALGAVLLCAIYIVVRPLANQFEPYSGPSAFAGMVLCLLGISCGTLLLLERHSILPARIALAVVLWTGLLAWGALRSPHLGRGLPYATDFAGYILLMLCGYVLARRDARLFPLACRLLIAMAVVEAFCGIWQQWVDFPRMLAAVREHHELLPDALQGSAGRARLFGGNVFGSFAYPNAFGAYLLLGMMLLTAGGSPRGRRWTFPLLAALCSLPMLLACCYSDSKGAFVALLGGAGAWFVFRQASRKPASARMWLGLAALGVAALAALLALATLGIIPTDFFGRSLQVRFEYWHAALRMIGMEPLQGVGLAGFAEHYTFFKTALGTEAKEAHNDFLQLWAELGPAGLLGYLGIWAMMLRGRRPALDSAAGAAAKEKAPAAAPAAKEAADAAVSARRFEWIALMGALLAFAFMYAAFAPLNAPDLMNLLQQPGADGMTAAGALFALAMPVVFGCVLIATRGIDGGAGLRLGVKAALCALLLHQLIDFDLRAQALAGAMFLLGGMLLADGAPRAAAIPAQEEKLVEEEKSVAGKKLAVPTALERCGRAFPLALSLLLLPLAFWIPAQAGLARAAAENDEADVQALLKKKPLDAESRAAAGLKQREIVRLRREVVEHVPYDSEAWVDLALAQDAAPLETSEAAHRRAVETSLQAALERRPYSHIPRLLLANFYAKNGAWADAAQWYQRAIERYPLHPGLRFWLGDALLMSGRTQPAAEAYNAAFTIDLRIVDGNVRASAMFSDPRAGVFSRHWREGEVLARVDSTRAEAARTAESAGPAESPVAELQRGLTLRRLLSLCTLYRDAERSGALSGTFRRKLLSDVHATAEKFAALQPRTKPGWRAHAALYAALSYQLAPTETAPAARKTAWQNARELQEQARQAGSPGTDPRLFERLRQAFDTAAP